MADLAAIAYPDEHRAAEVMATLKRLQTGNLIDLDDACYVTKDKDGNLKLHQGVSLTQAGALGGALWGTLIGMLFLVPVGGLVIGGAAGALSGKLSDYGIDDDFAKSLSNEMKPGSSAIFMLVRRATVDKVAPEIAKFGGKFLHTSISKEAEEKLQAMLDDSFQSALDDTQGKPNTAARRAKTR